VEPNDDHFYQPIWTLVGGGIKKYEDSVRKNLGIKPVDVYWYQNIVTELNPDENKVVMIDGTELEYQQLVIAAGIDVKFSAIPGLDDAIKDLAPGVCSNYSAFTVEKTWDDLQSLGAKARRNEKLLRKENKKLTAIFTQPSGLIKCPGAPQKIAYLADDYFRRERIRDLIDIRFYTGSPVLLGQPDYAKALGKVMEEKNITVVHGNELNDLTGYQRNFANFSKTGQVKYDFLHVVPPQGPLDFCKNSKLSDQAGYINVDKETLQHKVYKNVWSLGDCSNLPTAKTAAAVAEQHVVLFENLTTFIEHLENEDDEFVVENELDLPARYDGYASCPLPLGNGKAMVAEFDYDMEKKETFAIDQEKPSRFLYFIKAHVLPIIYFRWHLYGQWRGPKPFRRIFNPFRSNCK